MLSSVLSMLCLNPILIGTRFGQNNAKVSALKTISLNPILIGTRFGQKKENTYNEILEESQSYSYWYSVRSEGLEASEEQIEVSILFLLVLGSVCKRAYF